ncbi:helix-turn-helix transcriptional regulator [Chitinophaga sp. YIM B06452]|uniref:helix-turn-helix domain-containing protein n=1 Tax=Chitinophaga sp. YIM B06452 TaxID=3082158 RepID=UPI0031FEF67D
MKIKGKQDFLKMLACNLLFLRETKGLSMQKLCDEMEINKSNYAKWEEGICAPRYGPMLTIARFYGVTVDDLLTRYLSYGTAVKVA